MKTRMDTRTIKRECSYIGNGLYVHPEDTVFALCVSDRVGPDKILTFNEVLVENRAIRILRVPFLV